MENDAKRTPGKWKQYGSVIFSPGHGIICDALVATLQLCLDWLTSAPIDYSNDVVHSGMDEGNILGWQGHWELQAKIEAALTLATEENT